MEAQNLNTSSDNVLELPAEDESYDILSLRHLQSGSNSPNSTPRTSFAYSDIFEFLTSDQFNPITENFVFCGRSIPFDPPDRSSNGGLRTASFYRPDTFSDFSEERNRFSRRNRSESYRMRSAYSVQKVNITALTSMSPKARRRMFMFGPVKFKPEMELSAIRERQNRRTPAPMFPAIKEGEAVSDDRGKEEMNLAVRPRTCRGHFTRILAKSLCYR